MLSESLLTLNENLSEIILVLIRFLKIKNQ